MNKRQSQMYRMLVRVRDFGAAQKQRFPEATLAAQLFDKVGESVKQVEQFGTARTNALRRTAKAKAEAKADLHEALGALSQTARSIEAVEPSFVNKFQLPKRRNAEALLVAGRAFLEEARPFAAILAAHALQVDNFEAVLNGFETAVRKRDAGKELNADAKARIDNALDAGMKAARQLDAIVRNHLRTDKAIVAVWEQDRYVPYPKSGVVQAPEAAPAVIVPKAA